MTASSIHVISHDLRATTSFVRDMEHYYIILEKAGECWRRSFIHCHVEVNHSILPTADCRAV